MALDTDTVNLDLYDGSGISAWTGKDYPVVPAFCSVHIADKSGY